MPLSDSLRRLPHLAFGLAVVGGAAQRNVAAEAHAEFFENKIRPILAHNCFECHGPEKQKAGLRLDSRAAALAGGDLGPALIEGNPDKSLMIQAVRYTDDHLQMPPDERLSAADVADLEKWVKLGAPWPGSEGTTAKTENSRGQMQFTAEHLAHWAFQPINRPAVPAVKDTTWPRTDIDRFILAELEGAGLEPSPPAAPATLLRRLTFDLTGLPPSPDELSRFSAASSRDPRAAMRQAVAALLASPHYGERYGRHWLDVARYADTNGSEVDHAMANAWRYRDYVVRAFNADLPFDQFIREQIAGDLLAETSNAKHPTPTLALSRASEQITATGFLMLGPKAVADLDKPKLAADIVDEQIDTLSRAFLGMTVGCARCHDHKFDPIGDEDYYALAGIFSSTRTMVDMTKRVVTWTERPLGGAGEGERIEKLIHEIAELKERRDMLGSTLARPTPKLTPGQPFLLIEAEDFRKANVIVESDRLGKGIGVLRTRMEYPDRIEYEFELSEAGEYQLEWRFAAKESRPVHLTLNGNLEDMAAAGDITGDWTPAAQRWFVQGVYRFRAGKNSLVIQRDGPVPLFDKLLIGRVSGEPYSRHVPPEPARISAEETAALDAEKKKINTLISELQRELESIPAVMAPYEGKVADAPILIRGSPATPGEIVPRGFLRVVAQVETPKPGPTASGRRELAEWLTHPGHPLTARVIVNRVWLWHFGEGLVRSPDNFGLRGEKPSHPKLLDWLAVWFMENGWSLKKLHELICNSAVYTQATRTRTVDADPENRLFSSFPRRRLDAEALRDSMLAVSGQLDRTIGGTLMQVMNRTYANGGDAPPDIVEKMNYDRPRRSLYLPIVRNALHDFFAIFDYPDPGMLTGQRSQTTVAPQALFLMNSPFVREQAKHLAARVHPLGEDDTVRIQKAYTLAFSRLPSAAEMRAARAFLERDAAELGGDPKDARSTAWTRLCHTLLASNEFLYLR
jgi:mono/diheme cytochrome c family protein